MDLFYLFYWFFFFWSMIVPYIHPFWLQFHLGLNPFWIHPSFLIVLQQWCNDGAFTMTMMVLWQWFNFSLAGNWKCAGIPQGQYWVIQRILFFAIVTNSQWQISEHRYQQGNQPRDFPDFQLPAVEFFNEKREKIDFWKCAQVRSAQRIFLTWTKLSKFFSRISKK